MCKDDPGPSYWLAAGAYLPIYHQWSTMQKVEEFPIKPYSLEIAIYERLLCITKSQNVDPPRNPKYRIILTKHHSFKGKFPRLTYLFVFYQV
jgi:hypothetical protein